MRLEIRTARRVLAAGAIVCLLALAGCGDEEDAETTGGSGDGGVTSTTLEPPADGDRPGAGEGDGLPGGFPRNDDPSAVQCTGPPRRFFDATAVVGEPLSKAEAAAREQGCEIRVAVRDGRPLALTQDFRPDRVNVAVEDGEVSEIIDIG